jgi:aspartyl-tRNA synthetase
MLTYGSDKPDLRPGMPISDLLPVFTGALPAFVAEIAESSRAIRGFIVSGAGSYSRKQLDDLIATGTNLGGRIAWARIGDNGLSSSAAKVFGAEKLQECITKAGGGPGDLLLFMGGTVKQVADVLGRLRLHVAKAAGLLAADEFKFVWVTGVPAAGVERGRAAMGFDASPIHVAAAPGRGAFAVGAGSRAGARLRSRAQRFGNRRRQHPYSSRGRSAAHFLAAGHLR